MNDKPDTTPANLADEEDDMEDLRVTLTLDDDEEVECQILTIFDIDDQNYIVLLPVDDEEGDDSEEGEVYIYRYFEDEDGNPSLENIEDEEEYEEVTEYFEELLEEAAWDDMFED